MTPTTATPEAPKPPMLGPMPTESPTTRWPALGISLMAYKNVLFVVLARDAQDRDPVPAI